MWRTRTSMSVIPTAADSQRARSVAVADPIARNRLAIGVEMVHGDDRGYACSCVPPGSSACRNRLMRCLALPTIILVASSGRALASSTTARTYSTSQRAVAYCPETSCSAHRLLQQTTRARPLPPRLAASVSRPRHGGPPSRRSSPARRYRAETRPRTPQPAGLRDRVFRVAQTGHEPIVVSRSTIRSTVAACGGQPEESPSPQLTVLQHQVCRRRSVGESPTGLGSGRAP